MGEGGVMFEEATEEISVTYGIDGKTKSLKRPAPGEDNSEKGAKKRKRKKNKTNSPNEATPMQQTSNTSKSVEAANTGTENSLSRELAALRAAAMKDKTTDEETG